MLDSLLQWDEQLFRLINIDWQTNWLDVLMPYWRHKLFWSPLYLLLLSFLLLNFGKKTAYYILAIVLVIVLADTMSSQIIKKNVQRIRPCNQEILREEVHLLVTCGSGYSFTSSHATNHFALAWFVLLTIGRPWRWLQGAALLWAGSIALGQVYVGVHFPLDILAGALLGTLIGIFVAAIYKRLKAYRIDFFYEKGLAS